MTAKNEKNIDIDAFEGKIGMYHKLNNKIATIDVKCTDKFPKNAEADFSWTVSEMDEYEAVDAMNKESGDVSFEFIPTKILIGEKEL